MKKKFCEVAFAIPVHREFTYEVPEDLIDAIVPGVRIIAPFRKRFLSGFVVGTTASSEVQGIKPIQDVVEPEPVFEPEMLRLTKWISDYYLSSWGEALKFAAPTGTAVDSSRVVRLLREPSEIKSESQRRLASALSMSHAVTVRHLSKKLNMKGLLYHLDKLQHEGIIEVSEQTGRPQVSIRYESLVKFADEYEDSDRLASVLNDLDKRAHKQSELLLKLAQLLKVSEGGVSIPQLLSLTRAKMSSLMALRDRGIVEVYERESLREPEYNFHEEQRNFELTPQQNEAVSRVRSRISSGEYTTFLLHGVTGSGKTQVYIEAIDTVLKSGRSAIVLEPEISLTPQIVDRFRRRFASNVAIMHSRMSLGERFDSWRRVRRGDARVVIGARSAVFAPVRNLGLIVVDEEHESSYKQSDSVPRYNARDVAVMRCALNKCVAVLGSATPSVESYYNASTGKYTLLELPERIDSAKMPTIEIIDMKQKRREKLVAGSLSDVLKQKIDDRLSKKEGIIILRNRRGFSTWLQCDDCGTTMMCPNCDVALTYHKKKKHLRCHYCGFVQSPPVRCPKCGSDKLVYGGTGTQKVEDEFGSKFPEAKILRMDLDTTSARGAHDRMLTEFAEGNADMLVGTQLVAKGLDFPRVTLVGVISADSTLLMPDFRSTERTFQLLTQVAGRAGRREKVGEVVIQVSDSRDEVLKSVAGHDYHGFYEREISVRKQLEYPPFSRMVVLEFRGTKFNDTGLAADRAASRIKKALPVIGILGPAPAVIGRLLGKFRFQIIIKLSKQLASADKKLQSLLDEIDVEMKRSFGNGVTFFADVDPTSTI